MNRVAQIAQTAHSNAQADLRLVKGLADMLASVMSDIHGGSCRIQIDHEVGLVVVANRPDKRIPRP